MLVNTSTDLENLVAKLKQCTEIAFDFETTDLHHKRMSVLGISFYGDKLDDSYYVNFDNSSAIGKIYGFGAIKNIFSTDATFIAHNYVFDGKVLKYFYNTAPKKIFDTMVAAWYLDENRASFGLKQLAKELLGIDMVKYKDVDKEDIDKFSEYGAMDSYATYQLYKTFSKELEKQPKLYSLFTELEMPFLEVLISITLAGFRIDHQFLRNMSEGLRVRREILNKELTGILGGININSTQQLCEALYGIQVKRVAKETVVTKVKEGLVEPKLLTPKGAPSTSDSALDKLDHPIIEQLKEYRGIEKLLTTYVEGYQRFIIDGFIYPNFNPIGTVSGRLCVHPDTLVEMPRDLTLYPNGVSLKNIKVGDIVYSFDENKELCLKRVKWVGPTGVKPTIVIHTDEGFPLTLSREHLVRKWNGTWVHAKDLKVGDRLLCMPKRGFSEGYSYFFPHSRNRGNGFKGGGKVKEHRFVALNGKPRSTNYPVHHKDENKLNNHPNNLEIVVGAPNHKIKHSYRGNPKLLEEAVKTGYGKTGQKLSEETIRKYKGQLKRNHKVTKIEEGPEIQLWDLEIEGTHTFIGNDIALHNSSNNPNMQNLPHAPTGEWFIRNAFICPEGYNLIVADESQLELRLLAHFSKDSSLVEAFLSEGDVHTRTASQILQKPPEEVTKVERQQFKTINFGIMYGMGPKKLADSLKISEGDAKYLLQRYFETYQGVREWFNSVERTTKKNGYIKTIIGRYRRLPDIWSKDNALYSRARRQAINSLIQGSAADILKVAMVKIYQAFKDAGLDAQILSQIHDELVVQCREGECEEAAEIMKDYMEHPFSKDLIVPLIVEPSIVKRWSDGK